MRKWYRGQVAVSRAKQASQPSANGVFEIVPLDLSYSPSGSFSSSPHSTLFVARVRSYLMVLYPLTIHVWQSLRAASSMCRRSFLTE